MPLDNQNPEGGRESDIAQAVIQPLNYDWEREKETPSVSIGEK
jgi:hypothetical protein